MNVLIVEDNDAFVSIVAKYLEQLAIASDRASTAAEATRSSIEFEYDAILLDLGLPDDGMRFLRDFRSRGCVAPVLITTARSELRHRLLALREGADDYLVKPFSLEELVARLQALVRRPRSLLGRHLVAGNLAFDPETHQIRIGGTFAPLRLKEAFVLELLLRYKGTVVPRSYIEAQLFGLDGSQDANVIDVYIHRIRKRLADGGATVTVHTVRGIGFLLTEDR